MYPAQTSFIPLTVALARFADGHSVWGKYDFWYLGEVPFRYLTGPVVPAVILGLHAVFGGLSLFDWSILLVIASWAIAAFGWGILAWRLSGVKSAGIAVGFLNLVLPWHIVSSLALGEVSAVLASSFGPWILVTFISSARRFKKRSTKRNSDSISDNSVSWPSLVINSNLARPVNRARSVMFLKRLASLIYELVVNCYTSIILFAILLLINTVSSIPTILGLLILGLVLYKHPTDGLKRAGSVVFLGGLLTLWWYDPGYWLRILFAPSFGGRSVVGAFLHVVDLARTLAPVVLAFIVVVWKVKPKSSFEKFAYLWLGGFVGLTLVRFAANIHFWLDWTSWFGEIEAGLAMMLAGFFGKNALVFGHSLDRDQRSVVDLHKAQTSQNSEITSSRVTSPRIEENSVLVTRRIVFIVAILLVGTWFLVWSNRSFWMPRKSIENMAEYKIAKWLETSSVTCELLTVNCPTVFLSGTSAFWLNSLFDIRQVRGGADYVGLKPDLARVVWEVREGASAKGSYEGLEELGVNYLVVHDATSKEYYHDFSNVEKFEEKDHFVKVYEADDDVIYKINPVQSLK